MKKHTCEMTHSIDHLNIQRKNPGKMLYHPKRTHDERHSHIDSVCILKIFCFLDQPANRIVQNYPLQSTPFLNLPSNSSNFDLFRVSPTSTTNFGVNN